MSAAWRYWRPRPCCCCWPPSATPGTSPPGRSRAPARRLPVRSSGIHRLEELGIALRVAQLVEQEVDPVHGAHRVEDAAQHVHLLDDLGFEQLFLFARTRVGDVDCREGALVRNLAVQAEL